MPLSGCRQIIWRLVLFKFYFFSTCWLVTTNHLLKKKHETLRLVKTVSDKSVPPSDSTLSLVCLFGHGQIFEVAFRQAQTKKKLDESLVVCLLLETFTIWFCFTLTHSCWLERHQLLCFNLSLKVATENCSSWSASLEVWSEKSSSSSFNLYTSTVKCQCCRVTRWCVKNNSP